MWERGILSDGGVNARKTSTLSGEPLIEGMLVGTEKDIMDTPQLHQVFTHEYSLYSRFAHAHAL